MGMDDRRIEPIIVGDDPEQSDYSKQVELSRMKFLATVLLIFAFIVFLAASIFENNYPWLSFVRASAEAAMIGGVADWFAVTALFRHPLGLKIPHTAIIPTRKEVLGFRLGHFVRENFLTREVIAEKLRSIIATQSLTRWLADPAHSALVADQVAIGIAAIVGVMKDEEIQGMIENSVTERIHTFQIAPLLGNAVSFVISGDRQRELLSGTIKLGSRLLQENKESIQKRISRETPWFLPRSVDRSIYNKIVDAVDKTLTEVSNDPDHPIHDKFSEVVSRLVEDLKHSPEVTARERAFKDELLQDATVRDFSSSLWADIKRAIIEQSSQPNQAVRRSIQHGLVKFAETILADEILLKKINSWVEDGSLYLIEKYGHEVELLIAQTISRWDAAAASQKIELEAGKDLQFIRINGTLVGGLVGLLIHTLSHFL
jgi:uncharacterized membrane-anchored protein YjiN (DUF445 family)